MLKKLIDMIEARGSWKTALLLFLISAALASLIISQAGGLLAIDARYTMDAADYYTAETFHDNLEKLGEPGRRTYLYIHLIDYVYIIFSYPFFAVMVYLVSRNMKNYQRYRWFLLLPLGAGVFDLLENISIDLAILFWPAKLPVVPFVSGYLTTLKMAILYCVFSLIACLGVYRLIRAAMRAGKKLFGREETD
jgi:hypothetical protein